MTDAESYDDYEDTDLEDLDELNQDDPNVCPDCGGTVVYDPVSMVGFCQYSECMWTTEDEL